MTELRVPTRCETDGTTFDIVFRDEDDTWLAVDAERRADAGGGGDGGDTERMEGSFAVAPEYDGCPSCGRTTFFKCHCGSLGCWDGQTDPVTCPWCDATIHISGDIDDLDGVDDSGVDRGPDSLTRR